MYVLAEDENGKPLYAINFFWFCVVALLMAVCIHQCVTAKPQDVHERESIRNERD